jgi:tripartite-type tricarboxylate transporter receptor subunit TctC
MKLHSLNRRQLIQSISAVVGSVSGLALPIANAQSFPSKSLTILVPFPAGGPTDLMARVLGEILTERMGQSVIVDNRPGGGGQIAGGALIRSIPDGHTLMLGEMSMLAVNALLFKSYAYDPFAEFLPVTSMLSMPMMILAPGNSSINTLQDLVNRARSKPLNYGTPGAGTVAHLAGEQLRSVSKTELTHIPYKGSAPLMTDLIGGQLDFAVDGVGPALPNIREGKIKAIAVAMPKRSPALPNVPTTAEAGYPSVVMDAQFGLVTKTGTPAPIVQKLYEEIALALRHPKFTSRFNPLGFEAIQLNPEQFRARIRSETDRQGALIKSAGIALE